MRALQGAHNKAAVSLRFASKTEAREFVDGAEVASVPPGWVPEPPPMLPFRKLPAGVVEKQAAAVDALHEAAATPRTSQLTPGKARAADAVSKYMSAAAAAGANTSNLEGADTNVEEDTPGWAGYLPMKTRERRKTFF